MKNIKKWVRHNAGTIWEDQPRDEKGRWVKTGTRLSKLIKNKADRDKIRKNLKALDNQRKLNSTVEQKQSSTKSTKPLKISKDKLKTLVAKSVGKTEASKLDKDFNEVYKPSPEVAEKLKSKTASPRGVDKLIDKEAHEPYMKAAKASLITDREDASPKAVKELAYEYATIARSQEFDKIRAITKEEYIFKTKKGEIELDTEDTYQGQWVNQYKVRNDDGKIIDKGLFRTAEELKKILE